MDNDAQNGNANSYGAYCPLCLGVSAPFSVGAEIHHIAPELVKRAGQA